MEALLVYGFFGTTDCLNISPDTQGMLPSSRTHFTLKGVVKKENSFSALSYWLTFSS